MFEKGVGYRDEVLCDIGWKGVGGESRCILVICGW
jgi:hypothetical protein